MSRGAISYALCAVLGGAAAAAIVLGLGRTSTTHTTVRRAALSTAAIAQSASSGSRSTSSSVALTAGEIYRRSAPDVVAIDASSTGVGTRFPFSGISQSSADSGSGIVVSKSGLILTNDHVVSGATTINVTFNGASGIARSATVVATDADDDLALLKVNPNGVHLQPLSFVASAGAEVGDAVYAIGNPYGLDQTLTTGVVSALGRQIKAPNGHTISGVIQTDAALNPGNSGGPLLNAADQVIGINSQIATGESQGGNFGDESQAGNTGIGFAVPSTTAKNFVAGYRQTH